MPSEQYLSLSLSLSQNIYILKKRRGGGGACRENESAFVCFLGAPWEKGRGRGRGIDKIL